MKKSSLKSLISHIIRESLIKKLGEGQPVGGVKNDHDFDEGRHGVMKAVNVAENDTPDMNTLEVYRETGVKCGKAKRKKDQGTVSHLMDWFHRAVRMEEKMSKKLAIDAFNKGYREGTGYSQQEKPQYFREKVGFDGKYVDDMESGVAVKKLHNLDENDDTIPGKFVNRGEVKLEGGLDYDTAYKIANNHWDIFGQSGKDERGVWNFKTRGDRWCCSVGKLNGKPAILSVTTNPGRLQLLTGDELGMNEQATNSNKQKFVYPENFKSVKNYIRVAKKPDTGEFVVSWYENGKRNEEKSYYTNDSADAWNTFALTKMSVDKANNPNLNNGLNEESGTGGVAGYSTPFSFSKNKQGSSRAIASAKKYGTVVKSISEIKE